MKIKKHIFDLETEYAVQLYDIWFRGLADPCPACLPLQQEAEKIEAYLLLFKFINSFFVMNNRDPAVSCLSLKSTRSLCKLSS